MLEKLMNLLGTTDQLLDVSRNDCLEMIRKTREMFLISVEALRSEVTDEVWNRLTLMDQEVNRQQMEVRRKVFSHLAVARNRDLLTGLQLVSIVSDVERVGDYTKNIGELAMSSSGTLDFGGYEEEVQDTERKVLALFDGTHSAVGSADLDTARAVMRDYREVSFFCDRSLEEILIDAPAEGVEASMLVLVLHLRYLKRVGAHLKNAASAVLNPYHRIGYDASSGQ